MVLAGENDFFHARRRERADNLLGVEVRGIEDLFRLITVAPFLVREGVHGEVQEGRDLQLLPLELPRAGNRAVGGGRRGGAGQGDDEQGYEQSHGGDE